MKSYHNGSSLRFLHLKRIWHFWYWDVEYSPPHCASYLIFSKLSFGEKYCCIPSVPIYDLTLMKACTDVFFWKFSQYIWQLLFPGTGGTGIIWFYTLGLMSHISNNFWLDSESLPSTPNKAEQIVEFCQIGCYRSLLTYSLFIAFKDYYMCVCVVFFFGLNQAHASNISYLAEAFIPICDQISKSREAKMYHSSLK